MELLGILTADRGACGILGLFRSDLADLCVSEGTIRMVEGGAEEKLQTRKRPNESEEEKGKRSMKREGEEGEEGVNK